MSWTLWFPNRTNSFPFQKYSRVHCATKRVASRPGTSTTQAASSSWTGAARWTCFFHSSRSSLPCPGCPSTSSTSWATLNWASSSPTTFSTSSTPYVSCWAWARRCPTPSCTACSTRTLSASTPSCSPSSARGCACAGAAARRREKWNSTGTSLITLKWLGHPIGSWWTTGTRRWGIWRTKRLTGDRSRSSRLGLCKFVAF